MFIILIILITGLDGLWAKKLENIALQLYTVRGEMKKDFEGTLKKVSEIGYSQVEFAGYFGKKPWEVKAILKKYNLEAVAAHVPYKDLKKDPARLCQETAETGIKYMVIAWVTPLDRITRKQYSKLAELFNRAGKICKKSGVQFIYHNHDFEFKGKAFETPYDILLNETDSSLVKQELDLFWIAKAGKDAVKYMNKYKGRFTHFHVKDMDKKGKMVDVGKGSLDFPEFFRVGEAQGVKYFVVEHDKPDDAFKSIENSYRYLKALEY